MELSTKEKAKKIGMDKMSKDDIYKLHIDIEYDKLYNNTSVRIKEPKIKKKISKNNKKYHVVLRYINKLLTAIGKETVDDICLFKNIDRRELIKIDGNKIVDDSLEDILSVFKKRDIDYTQRDRIKRYHVSILKRIVKKINYKVKSNKKGNFKGIYWIEYNIV